MNNIILSIITLLVFISVVGGIYVISTSTPPKPVVVVEVPQPAPTPTLRETSTFLCQSGQIITAQFFETPVDTTIGENGQPTPTGSVALLLMNGQTVTLPQTIAASGVKYAAADESIVFWVKGNEVMVQENGQETTYLGCVALAPVENDAALAEAYVSPDASFSIRLPSLGTTSETFTVKTATNTNVTPNVRATTTRFTIPATVATGTNLARNSYLSIEQVATTDCDAADFLDVTATSSGITENGTTYSFATSTDPGAGNRYDETIYAQQTNSGCIAIRYLIHSTALENYPEGTISAFDTTALLALFDGIRRTLIIN